MKHPSTALIAAAFALTCTSAQGVVPTTSAMKGEIVCARVETPNGVM